MMKTITEQELRDVLRKHYMWFNGKKAGKRADLSNTDLTGADLSGAYLTRADFTGANLTDADLSGANLICADLRFANLSGADLSGSNLRRANLHRAILTGTIFGYDIPVVKDIHVAVYEAASQEDALNMDTWHKCGTTHCWAGWVVHLVGDEGYALEKRLSTQIAAVAIYEASDPGFISREGMPDFHASNEDALDNMKRLSEAA